MKFTIDDKFLQEQWEKTKNDLIQRGENPDEMLRKASETVDYYRSHPEEVEKLDQKLSKYLERVARKEFELRETGICTKGCCTPEALEADKIMQEAIKKPIDGKNAKPLTRKRSEIK